MSKSLADIIKQQALEEQNKISSAIIQHDCDYLITHYQTIAAAEKRLIQLKAFLSNTEKTSTD